MLEEGRLRRPERLCDVAMPTCSLQLARDRSRAEEYLEQSLPYLQDAQASLRDAAIRFIGEPPPPVPLWATWPQATVLPRVTLLRGEAVQLSGQG